MITAELYREGRPTVVIERDGETNPGAWARLQEALARGIDSGSAFRTVVHADVFLSELRVLRELRVRLQIIWDIRACFRLEALAHP